MAHHKAGGSSTNGRDSAGRRLGIKRYAGQWVSAGTILCRQRGTKWYAGINTMLGKDHTIFAIVDGIVRFVTKGSKERIYIDVIAEAEA